MSEETTFDPGRSNPRCWYNHSEWGRMRKQRIAAFWICIGTGALVGTLLALIAR